MALSKFCIILFSLLTLFGCSVGYNFSGSSVPENAQKMYIGQFYNQSTGGPADLEQRFTSDLQNYFQRNTKLSIEKRPIVNEPSLEGTITDYKVSIAGASSTGGAQSASVNRLTITVKATYNNPYNEKDNFSQNFSFAAEYPAEQSLSTVENGLIEQINQQLILKIFAQCFGNW